MPDISPQIHASITEHLLTTKSLAIAPGWLTTFLATQSRLPSLAPLPALTKTAVFRVLASDFTDSLATDKAVYLLPGDIGDPNIKSRRLHGPVALQVLDITDMGTSRMAEVEAIERIERGEERKGREINRAVPVEATDGNIDAGVASVGAGPHKLLLQDARGTKVTGIELKRVDGVKVGMSIGVKLVLRNLEVARGVILLDPRGVTMLGGKIEEIDKVWKEGRKVRLLRELQEGGMQNERGGRDG